MDYRVPTIHPLRQPGVPIAIMLLHSARRHESGKPIQALHPIKESDLRQETENL